MQVLAHMTGMGLQARRRRIQQLGDDICLGWLEPQDRREEIMRHHHNLQRSSKAARWHERWNGMDTEMARTRAACADCCAIALSAALPLAATCCRWH